MGIVLRLQEISEFEGCFSIKLLSLGITSFWLLLLQIGGVNVYNLFFQWFPINLLSNSYQQ